MYYNVSHPLICIVVTMYYYPPVCGHVMYIFHHVDMATGVNDYSISFSYASDSHITVAVRGLSAGIKDLTVLSTP